MTHSGRFSDSPDHTGRDGPSPVHGPTDEWSSCIDSCAHTGRRLNLATMTTSQLPSADSARHGGNHDQSDEATFARCGDHGTIDGGRFAPGAFVARRPLCAVAGSSAGHGEASRAEGVSS